jgi:predicted nucleotidyltransferase
MKNTILNRLRKIEIENHIKILYACESGSRAWGFPSADSDYDVRFIYLHPVEWYLSFLQKRDVIEYLVDDQLDISGWDLKKALNLFRKSNPPLMEWLGSPIVYLEEYSTARKLRLLADEFYSPTASSYHYLRMAQGKYRDTLKPQNVSFKKYFYALRPILAIDWMQKGLGVVPTEFEVMVDTLVEEPSLKQAISDLIQAKREGKELDDGPRIGIISEFIEREISRLEGKQFEIDFEKVTAPIKKLDALFLQTLDEVWDSGVN